MILRFHSLNTSTLYGSPPAPPGGHRCGCPQAHRCRSLPQPRNFAHFEARADLGRFSLCQCAQQRGGYEERSSRCA
jgi:hypothetical protein